MAYCLATDCRLYARHADLASYDFATEIVHASGEFDAMVRGMFETPVTPVDQLVTNIVAKWAAGLALLTRRAVAGNRSEYAEQLVSEARAAVKEILANPAMISATRRVSAPDGGDKTTVHVTDHRPVFDMNWGN